MIKLIVVFNCLDEKLWNGTGIQGNLLMQVRAELVKTPEARQVEEMDTIDPQTAKTLPVVSSPKASQHTPNTTQVNAPTPLPVLTRITPNESLPVVTNDTSASTLPVATVDARKPASPVVTVGKSNQAASQNEPL